MIATGPCDGLAVIEALGSEEYKATGNAVGSVRPGVGDAAGSEEEGSSLGWEGAKVATALGQAVSFALGDRLRWKVGRDKGWAEGETVGCADGVCIGLLVGADVGEVGNAVGSGVNTSLFIVGLAEDAADGPGLGADVQ